MNRIKTLLTRCLSSPIKMSLILGLLVVSLLPPMMPKHKGMLTVWINPPNRSWFFFLPTPDAPKVIDIPVLRTTKTSMAVESDVRMSDKLPDFTYDQYLQRFSPLRPPSRDWVYFSDFDSNDSLDIAFVSYENDSMKLFFYEAETMDKKREVLLSTGKRLKHQYLKYFQRPGDSLLYFTVVSQVAKAMTSTLYAYDYYSDALNECCVFENIAYTFMFDNFSQNVLFTVNNRSYFDFHIYNIDEQCTSSFQVDTSVVQYVCMPSKNIQAYPCASSTEFLINRGRKNASLSLFDLDSLFLSRKVILKSFTEKMGPSATFTLKSFSDKLIFYTSSYRGKKPLLYKYNPQTGNHNRIRLPKDSNFGQLMYYGLINDNESRKLIYTDVKRDYESVNIIDEKNNHDFVHIPIQRERFPLHNCSWEESGKINFEGKGLCWVLNYQRNKSYYQRWFIYAAIVVLFLFLGFVIKQMRDNREYRRQEARNKIMQLQLENVQKRIDPHFIFNSLNNLGSLILEGESNESYDYLSKVSGVLYKALRNRSILISIEEELNFCTSVLDAQRQRFNDKFDYEVFIDQQVDLQQQMPSNILNNMVDNCIKHGFSGITYLGMITIEILMQDHGYLVVVEDNGKGRKAAHADKDQTKSTGTGLDICNQYVRLLNHGRKHNLLSFNIVDLYQDCTSPKGTRCEFYVPENLN